ncbi:MAG: hypothetical protein QXJ02_05370 [Candidatus Bathyarchaeia archaeon]
MIVPCEVAVKSVVPAVKALIANELIEEYDFDQAEVAAFLGISQSAVSKYTHKVRGHAISVEDVAEVRLLAEKMTRLLVSGHGNQKEFLRLFCQTCVVVRRTRLMCQFCKKSQKKLEIGECDFCLGHTASTNRK